MFIEDGSKIDYLYSNHAELLDTDRSYVHIAHELAYGETVEEIISDADFMVCSPKYKNLYAWGWIDDEIPAKSFGWKSIQLKNEVIEKLKNVDKEHIVDRYCGHHTCEICEAYGFEGSIKIRYNDKIYCCPRGVDHYIEQHDYCPDQEVIDAILNGYYMSPKDLVIDILKMYPKQIEKEKKIREREIADRNKQHEERERRMKKERDALIERIGLAEVEHRENLVKKAIDGENNFFVKIVE